MLAKVWRIYKNGRQLTSNKKSVPPVVGDLNLGAGKNPITGRVTSEASVLTDRGLSLIPNLVDVVCIAIAADGLRLRGVEILAGRELAQEWWCILTKSPITNSPEHKIDD